jgi:hypothetical protein
MNTKKDLIVKQLASSETYWNGFDTYSKNLGTFGFNAKIVRALLLGLSKEYVTLEKARIVSFFIFFMDEEGLNNFHIIHLLSEEIPAALPENGHVPTYFDLLCSLLYGKM